MCSTQSNYAPLVPSPLNPAIFPTSARNNTRTGEAMTTRIRPSASAPASAPTPAATPPPASMLTLAPLPKKRRLGPSEKLLRRKAAEAWKMEALHRQVMEYERQALGALSAKEKRGSSTSINSSSSSSSSRRSTSQDGEATDSQDTKVARAPRRPPRRRVTRRAARSAAMETVVEERQSEVEENDEDEGDEAAEGVTSEKVVKWHHFLQLPVLGFFAPKKLAKSLRFVRVLASWRVRRRRKADRD